VVEAEGGAESVELGEGGLLVGLGFVAAALRLVVGKGEGGS
jgi:hypothetical protein